MEKISSYTPDKSDRHIYLYAKYHYKRSNCLLSDMKIIIGCRCGIKPSHLSDRDVVECLLPIVFYHMKTTEEFCIFVSSILLKWYQPSKEYSFFESALGAILHILFKTLKSEIPFELGEPDSTILPLFSPRLFDSPIDNKQNS